MIILNYESQPENLGRAHNLLHSQQNFSVDFALDMIIMFSVRVPLEDDSKIHIATIFQHSTLRLSIQKFFILLLFRDSTLTRLLRESLGSTTCRVTMIGHISPSIPFYSESLSCVQFAARIHRLRRKKGKVSLTEKLS